MEPQPLRGGTVLPLDQGGGNGGLAFRVIRLSQQRSLWGKQHTAERASLSRAGSEKHP